jgi:hypothetical protein
MCQHIRLTTRSGNYASYELMDCSTTKDELKACEISDKSLAHLMASGQFKEIQVQDQKDATKGQLKYSGVTRIKTFKEEEFPAFIEKVLGSQALQERHHAPEAVGQLVR